MLCPSGYYNVDTQVVRKTMRVVRPPIQDYESLGKYISNYCSDFPTYRLESVIDYQRSKSLVRQCVHFQIRVLWLIV